VLIRAFRGAEIIFDRGIGDLFDVRNKEMSLLPEALAVLNSVAVLV